jgi:SAM-dependent methyltransferase
MASTTWRGYARGGSYARLAALAHGRVLDLGCGDGELLDQIEIGAVGLDLAARGEGHAVVRGDARELPFADGSFDTVVCHLAFMFFADARAVVELARVLAPGGRFLAVLGGGPTADGGDALAWFAARQAARSGPALVTEARWFELFAGWRTPPWERWPLELSGSIDEVCATLAAAGGFDAPFDQRDALRAAFPTDPIPCRAVAWLATAIRR